jgi:hypothetical protein
VGAWLKVHRQRDVNFLATKDTKEHKRMVGSPGVNSVSLLDS